MCFEAELCCYIVPVRDGLMEGGVKAFCPELNPLFNPMQILGPDISPALTLLCRILLFVLLSVSWS